MHALGAIVYHDLHMYVVLVRVGLMYRIRTSWRPQWRLDRSWWRQCPCNPGLRRQATHRTAAQIVTDDMP